MLFDLDGTLIDSNSLIIASFRHVFAKHFPAWRPEDAKIIALIGPPLAETFARLTDDPALIETMITDYLEVYRRLEFSYIDIYPHVRDVLLRFHAKGFNLGIVTTKFMASALPSIRHFGLDEFIGVIISLDEVKNHKPHPEPVEKALAAFRGHKQALMIGDAPSDILAGKNAGILTCGVAWTLKPEALRLASPDFWIDDYRELPRLIERYNKEA